jgi:hypothetical protein
MKMKKYTFLLLVIALMFVAMGDDCDDNGNGIPDPGFRIISVRVQGAFETVLPVLRLAEIGNGITITLGEIPATSTLWLAMRVKLT